MNFPTSIITQRRVIPNLHPIVEPTSSRIAIIGNAPTEDDECHGVPFLGRCGQFLDRILTDVGISRRECLLGNVAQVRPPSGDAARFAWNGPEIQEGLAKLRTDLIQFKPNICVLLGDLPLRASGIVGKVSSYRGSLFQSTSLMDAGLKCVPSIHPADVLADYSQFPLLKFDLNRAYQESRTPDLHLPQRELLTSCDPGYLIYVMDNWPVGRRCSLDIEGGLAHWPCVSICGDPSRSITIAWERMSIDDHSRVLRSFARLMARTDVPKVLQNSLYDNFVLSYGNNLPIRNVAEDTMLKGWEVYCELPKGLGTQCSIWTREPYYKSERTSSDRETYFQYCAKDSAVTLEICNAQDAALQPHQQNHYRTNVALLNPLLFMELRGIRYDTEAVANKLAKVKQEIADVAKALIEVSGHDLRGAKGSLSSTKLGYCLYQRDPGVTPKGRLRPKTAWKNARYPPQFKKEMGRKTDKTTTDIEAMLNLRKKFPGDTFLDNILKHRHLEGLIETLSIKCDPDSRIRCGYNVVGTETGRLTCYGSPTGAGANLTTITKSLRSNYCADPKYDFFQCDLEGADGWTVAAHCAKLGDRTMLDDYYAGIKPAKVIGLLFFFGPVINQLDRESLKFHCDRTFPLILKVIGKWLYLGCKRVQHGSNYLMGIPTMLLNIMKDSYKESGTPVYMEHSVATTLQNLYFSRYPGVKRWHQWAETMVSMGKNLISASGQERVFFGRKWEWHATRKQKVVCHDTVKEFLAHEPQSNTTWATNLAMLKLWNDPDNRRPDGSLIIEPLHQVHDALCGQWPIACRDWARAKVRTYFNNELTIAGTTLTIPFDGAFGPSWGEQPHRL